MENRAYLIISELINYALKKELIDPADEAYATASLMSVLGLSDFSPVPDVKERELSAILSDACDFAFSKGLIEEDSVVFRDLFDAKLMGVLLARPSEVIRRFNELYSDSPAKATDYFYSLACNSNYIRTDRIKRDMKWSVDSEFGEIDITINLSKPEKDPKAIAKAKLLAPSGYPKCLLCHENEGYAGDLSKPARQNLRQIPFSMAGTPWFLQYSPYVYYNEHCIALSAEHTPMKIDRSSFEKLLGFVECFPHYFIGSNADLPIVGGSILSHDHMQGGRYSFAMERAKEELKISFTDFEDVSASIIKWPLSVIRLSGKDKDRIVSLADKILVSWREYSDPESFIFSATDNEPHNTITPIARRKGELYELDLTLRNNITTEEHPLGLFHPHSEHHNIKKENIGLIEVMGLAVLPARLKEEIALMKHAVLSEKSFSCEPKIEKHTEWFNSFKENYVFTEENTEQIIKEEIGKTFVKVLTDAGVFKCTEEGRRAFLKFVDFVNRK